MSVNLIIKYVYGGPTRHKPKDSTHQISQHRISKYLKDRSLLNYKDIVDLLKSDGAQFYPNSIRYYNPYSQAYLRMEEDFTLELSSNSGWLSNDSPMVLRLWIKDANFVLRSKIKELSHRVKQLEQIQDVIQFPFPRQESRHGTQTKLAMGLGPNDRKVSSPNLYIPSLIELKPKPSLFLEDCSTQTLFLGSLLESNSSEMNTFPLSSNTLDIAIMYAEPLARTNGKVTHSLPDAVEYEEECNKIYETLERKELKISLAIEIASRENLIKVLSRDPVILHILCHGEYDKDRKQFYLCFETSDGELDPFYADDLRTILGNLKTDIKLVFVNACHSEAVASVFADAGVPCVIAVQSQLQIADVIARKFANEFYHFIFDGHTLGDSFNKALLASKSKECHSCCCGHQHEPNCKWYQMAIEKGFSYAHLYHDPVCVSCPKKHEHIHKERCTWAQNFMEAYGPADNWVNLESEFATCCCSPQLPHNELLKFIKVTKNPEESDKLVLYHPKEPGKILFRKPGSIIEKRFPVERLIGRNKQMYDLFKILRGHHRFVQLVGKTGVGKTALAKQIANYLYARNYFKNKIAIINMDKFYSLSSVLADLYSEEEFVNDLKGFCEAMKSKDALFILEKCDSFIETNQKELFVQLDQIVQMTMNVKFIFILNQPLQMDISIATIKVENLYPSDAAKLLLAKTPLDKISD